MILTDLNKARDGFDIVKGAILFTYPSVLLAIVHNRKLQLNLLLTTHICSEHLDTIHKRQRKYSLI
jgi:hypothetical protein